MQPNQPGRSIMQQDAEPKHTARTTREFIRSNKWKVLDWSLSIPVSKPYRACIPPAKVVKKVVGLLKEAGVKGHYKIRMQKIVLSHVHPDVFSL